ncbi:hypothetical protein V9T40_005696 [Parthenolecanium corni]|uniref:Uncharacterized protein n=1 Tax=Parthenolecanium corni TaxID=536013 RepID=A0AAN9TX40_9HEMI
MLLQETNKNVNRMIMTRINEDDSVPDEERGVKSTLLLIFAAIVNLPEEVSTKLPPQPPKTNTILKGNINGREIHFLFGLCTRVDIINPFIMGAEYGSRTIDHSIYGKSDTLRPF